MEKMQTTTDAEALMRRATALVDAGRTGAARPLLATVRRLAPPSPAAAHLAARIALQDGAVKEASIELDAALHMAPENAELRIARAELRQQMGDLDGAARDAAEAVILDRHNATAKVLLGLLLLQLGFLAEATACLEEAAAAEPGNPAFHRALALAQGTAGDLDGALATLEAGIAAAPSSLELRNEAVMLCIRRRDFATADRISDEARKAGIADACTFGLRGHALSSLGSHDEAADAYADALKMQPNDPYIRHLSAASGYIHGETRAPEAYLCRIFDGYADRFDNHLISLGYRVPGAIRKVLAKHPLLAQGRELGPVLDLGCGTGLVALALSDLLVGPFTGVDLSSGMLEQANAKGLYAELRHADLMSVLAGGTERWPLMLAGDVLCYFGALEEFFDLAHARMEPGGWLVFSTEELLPHHDGTIPGNGDWALQRHGRYAHTLEYLERVAVQSGFRIMSMDRDTVRFEADMAVAGFLGVLERTRHDG